MEKKQIYDGKIIGLDIYNLTIEKRKVRREMIKHPGAAAILAFDEKDRIIMVRQPVSYTHLTLPTNREV